MPGVGEHEATIPDELMAALRRLANELAVPLSTVLLTAHAKVLGALSGECEVSTGYVVMKGRSPLLCRMTTEPRSFLMKGEHVPPRARWGGNPAREM